MVVDSSVSDTRVTISANNIYFATSPSYESGFLVSIRWRQNSIDWTPIYTISGDGSDEGSAFTPGEQFAEMFININVHGTALLTLSAPAFETSLEARVLVFPQPAF